MLLGVTVQTQSLSIGKGTVMILKRACHTTGHAKAHRRPNWKNPSIAPDASKDPLRRDFDATAIAPKNFRSPQHDHRKFPSNSQVPSHAYALNSFQNQNILLTSSSRWDNFLTFLINFSKDFVDILCQLLSFCSPFWLLWLFH